MNCRRISSLLSAYIDLELTGVEMLAVREHLKECSLCRSEHQTLQETKLLLSSLALKMPRPELEALLQTKTRSMENPKHRWLSFMGSVGIPSAIPLRLRTVAVTAVISVAALWLATVPVENSTSVTARSPLAETFPTVDSQMTSVSLPGIRPDFAASANGIVNRFQNNNESDTGNVRISSLSTFLSNIRRNDLFHASRTNVSYSPVRSDAVRGSDMRTLQLIGFRY